MKTKQHPYYEHLFVTEDGIVYSNKSGKLRQLTPIATEQGYLTVSVWVHKGKSLHRKVHRIVAETYVPNPKNLREVDHLDCDKKNNCAWNLDWVSSKENKRRARANGLYDNTIGEKHHNSALTEDVVHQVCQCLQDGMRNKDVAELFSIDKDLISHIKIGDLWRNISSQYKFLVKRNKRKSIDFVRKVCELISKHYSDREIVNLCNNEITLNDVQRIRAKNIHRKISDSYF